MDWADAIDFHRQALLRVLATLFALSGIAQGWTTVAGTPVATLPRPLHCQVTRLLRPAESGARRLIVALAQEVSVVLKPLRPRAVPKPQKPEWLRGGPIRSGLQIRQEAEAKVAARLEAARQRIPAFPLFDTRKHFPLHPPRRYAKHGPQIHFFGYDDYEPVATPDPDPPLDAERLCKRLQSLQHALEDLPAQARRMAQMIARREETGRRPVKPMRPGRPPGHRARQTREVDKVLATCHQLALGIWDPDDTS